MKLRKNFVAATMLMSTFSVRLGWFPAFGNGEGVLDRIQHLTLPAIALAGASMALVARVTRTSVRGEVDREHVQTAVSRGLPRGTIIRRHVLRNAAIPITTVAGNGQAGYSGDGGPALQASFNKPHEIRFDAAGNCYVADMVNHAIRRIDAKSGIITTIAGNRRKGYSGDGGPAVEASLSSPHSIQFGPEGDLYICDIGNHVIRRIDLATGVITTVLGTGVRGDGPETSPGPFATPSTASIPLMLAVSPVTTSAGVSIGRA